MSYARFSDESSVYVYNHVGGFIDCCGCLLGDKWDYHSVSEIVAHMQEHVTAGHKVPAYLLDWETYDDASFVAMCSTFMCHEDTGHDGEHTPLSGWFKEQGERIRAASTSKETP